jgi:uncharacterized membrane protein YcjF (UPF0283 family)
MLTHLPSLIQQLWARRVDIAVGVTTSVIVGVIGLLFWRVKLWLDLRADDRKQHQQNRNEEKFARERRRQEARDRHERLKRERDDFATNVEEMGTLSNSIANGLRVLAVWDRYVKWVHDNELQHLPQNMRAFTEHADLIADHIRTLNWGPKTYVDQMVPIIRATELPDPNA